MVQPKPSAARGGAAIFAAALVMVAGCMPGPLLSSFDPSATAAVPTASSSVLASPPAFPASPPASAGPAMEQVGGLAEARYEHTATLLRDGRVLIAGGRQLTWDADNNIHAATLSTVELFDPATVTWMSGPALHEARSGHTATLLSDGRVLVLGGFSGSAPDGLVHSAEVYDPTANRWTVIDAPIGAADHSATLLGDGRVLVVGWHREASGTDAWAIFAPTSATWTAPKVTDLVLPLHTAVALRDGTVLAAGGTHPVTDGPPPPNAAAARFDPATGTWTAITPMGTPRLEFAAVLLEDGTVLAVDQGSAELFDPVRNQWSPTAGTDSPRLRPVPVALADGRVLLVGEQGQLGSKPILEIYDPSSATWSDAAAYPVTDGPTATRLRDGRVLIVGGLKTCFAGTGCSSDTLTGDTYLFDPSAR
jgi:hypothetical protein